MAPPSPLLGLAGMGDELRRIEATLRDAVEADDPLLTEVAGHLVHAGGKRVRPALAVAVGATTTGGRPVRDEVVRGGVSVELVHLGSLYHDDVIDAATTRRGVQSVNARWGNLTAILAGDFLLARASQLAAELGTEVAALLASTIGTLCEGELRELQRAFDVTRSEEQYLLAVQGKTASLFAAACRIGALVAGLDRAAVDAATTFGDRYGMAFQVVDDILDVVATEETLGKPAGNDLAEGVYTLPVLYALASPSEGAELGSLLGRPLEGPEVERARKLVQGGDGVERARRRAEAFAEEAVGALGGLPPGAAVDALAATARHVLTAVPG